MNRGRETCFFPEAGSLQNPHLEIDTFGIVLENQPRMLHECGERDSAGDRRLVAGVIDEVNRSGFGHEVDGAGEEDEEG